MTSNKSYTYYFICGLFVAFALSPHLLATIILGVILILGWGNYILPITAALLTDISLVSDRHLQNLYGLLLTLPTIAASLLLLKLRKFLKF